MSSSDDIHPSLYFGVLVISNPDGGSYDQFNDATTVSESISFRTTYDDAVVFYGASKDKGTDLSALLYVPLLSDRKSCGLESLPSNATHLADLPARYNTVAIAPLTSPDCAKKWMERAHLDGAQDLIFYGPEDYTSDTLLNSNDSVIPTADWLGDTTGLTYSIYYVPGTIGGEIVHYMSLYSGNMTGVPYGDELVEYFDFRDYVRVAVEIDSPYVSKMPGLWVFLVIALAVVLCAAVGTSVFVHVLQYRNRRRLRRRIENGEIDLEALGIKRLTVPRWILDKLPIRIYTPGEAHYAMNHSVTRAASPTTTLRSAKPTLVSSIISRKGDIFPTQTGEASDKSVDLTQTEAGPGAVVLNGYSQPTCPICLDDFVAGTTQVRELPCLHIYHLECIDAFLEHQSSLCPLCKQSALPKGYIPSTLRITNATVRREQRLRRERGDTGRRWFSRRHRRGRNSTEDGIELQTLEGVRRPSHAGSVADESSIVHSAPGDTVEANSAGPGGRRTTTEHLAHTTPGAVVADDGTVFVVEETTEETHGRRVLHMLFPYLF